VAGTTAAWLFGRYRPSAADVDPALLDGTARSSATWLDVHQGALLVLLGLLVVVLVTGPAVVAEGGRGPGRPVAAGLVALVGGIGAAVGALTTPLVAWDQVALDEVTVGADLGGWRLAAFDDRVRFVLVDGAEVAPGSYATALVVHLVAPAVTLAALVAIALLVRTVRRRGHGAS
jgi:hypothetical protein